MSEPIGLASDGLTWDAPGPWLVVPVDMGDGLNVWHLVDARGHTLLSSSAVNGRGPELQKRILERIAANENATTSQAIGLALTVRACDLRGEVQSTKRHAASSLLADVVAGVTR